MSRLMPLKEETAEFDFAMLRYSKMKVICKQGRRFSTSDTVSAGTLIAGFLGPELSEICLLFKPPSLRYFVRAAWANWDKRLISGGVLHGWYSSKFQKRQTTFHTPSPLHHLLFSLFSWIMVIFPQGDNSHSHVGSTNLYWWHPEERASLFLMNAWVSKAFQGSNQASRSLCCLASRF